MDRFIEYLKLRGNFCMSHLKSNMDRFIVNACYNLLNRQKNLKSNMDRFIVLPALGMNIVLTYLKSNMDRFIASIAVLIALRLLFKIQYG